MHHCATAADKTSAALLWRRHASCNRSFVNVHEKPRQGIRQHCLVKASRPSPAQLCYSAIPDKKSYPNRKLFASNPLELHEGRIKRKRPKKRHYTVASSFTSQYDTGRRVPVAQLQSVYPSLGPPASEKSTRWPYCSFQGIYGQWSVKQIPARIVGYNFAVEDNASRRARINMLEDEQKEQSP